MWQKHATFVIIFFCPTGPALEVPRLPAIECAALQPQATCGPVHGQHSGHLPFCEAPARKFLPGHPGAIHGPWSQHCCAAPATEFPWHWMTPTTRSHAPFAWTIPSANETATTMRSQTSRVRDLNQTFCIQKSRDMHICLLTPNIFPNILRIFSAHMLIFMFTLTETHLVHSFTSEPRNYTSLCLQTFATDLDAMTCLISKQCHDMLDFKTKSLSPGPYPVIERHTSKQQHRCVVTTLV